MSTRSKAKVPPSVAAEVQKDIDDAIRRRDPASLRNFAAEAAASGMDQESARAFEIAAVIETKAASSAHAELLKIKSALEPPEPTQAQLVAQWDAMAMGVTRSSFDRTEFEDLERERIAERNKQLAQRDRQREAERRRQIGEDEPEPWWRR
jgi:hypothetical protein